ncbi:hypothetical protein L218DRAFT_609152 [Marasmius fiardii PR-910]|nr:hypothetical protein L218DRAFT_609152 [Marasmius fiardii PR-910]
MKRSCYVFYVDVGYMSPRKFPCVLITGSRTDLTRTETGNSMSPLWPVLAAGFFWLLIPFRVIYPRVALHSGRAFLS